MVAQTVCFLRATCKFNIHISHIKHITSKNILMFMMKLLGSNIYCRFVPQIFHKISSCWAWDFAIKNPEAYKFSKDRSKLTQLHSMGSSQGFFRSIFWSQRRFFVPVRNPPDVEGTKGTLKLTWEKCCWQQINTKSERLNFGKLLGECWCFFAIGK